MTNQNLCFDLHVIRVVSDGSQQHPQNNAAYNNSYNWNIHKNINYVVPEDYPYDYFDSKFFWILKETFNYMNSLWLNGEAVPHEWNQVPKDNQKKINNNNDNSSSILWIDKSDGEISQIEIKLKKDHNISIDFVETFAEAEKYIFKSKKKVESSSSVFQIVCRGYYRDEDKNPLDILKLLDFLEWRHVPVLVFTSNKVNLRNHLETQAPSMNIRGWTNRLFITTTSMHLLNRIEKNLSGKTINQTSRNDQNQHDD